MKVYIEATLWDGDECWACWTSEVPGKTGPAKTWREWWRMRRSGWRLRIRFGRT